MSHLKQWWTVHATLVAGILGFFVPSFQAYATGHPKSLFAAVLTLVLSALWTDKPGPGGNVSSANRSIILLFLLLMIPGSAKAQNFNTFSLTASPVSLPNNKATIMGTVAGLTFTPTVNVDLREDNLIVPGSNLTGFFGGFNYRLPSISTKVNNISPTLNGYRFQFYVTASAGVDRISGPVTTAQHYAFLAGGGINYDLTGSGTWTMGVEVRYAKLPGLANNTAIVSVGPAFHF